MRRLGGFTWLAFQMRAVRCHAPARRADSSCRYLCLRARCGFHPFRRLRVPRSFHPFRRLRPCPCLRPYPPIPGPVSAHRQTPLIQSAGWTMRRSSIYRARRAGGPVAKTRLQRRPTLRSRSLLPGGGLTRRAGSSRDGRAGGNELQYSGIEDITSRWDARSGPESALGGHQRRRRAYVLAAELSLLALLCAFLPLAFLCPQ